MLVIISRFVIWFGCSLLSFFFNKKIFLIIIFFILITFKFNLILSSFCLSIFPLFILSRVDDRLLVLQPGVRDVPLR